jgi:glycosyltransferase involved in cell wall biosynthesis
MLRSAWVNLVPSSQEGWGLTVIEAAASGTPSVASDIPGLSDTMIPGVTGLNFARADATSFASGIRTLLTDEEQRRTLGESARRFARSLTWESHVAALERLLEQVYATSRANPSPNSAPRSSPGDRFELLR